MLLLRPALLVPLVLIFRVSAAEAQPYEREQIDGPPLCRNTRTLSYSLATSGTRPTTEERAAVVAAFNTWNQAMSSCSDLVFQQAADVPGGTPLPQDGNTLVSFRKVKCEDVVPSNDPCWSSETCVEKYDCWSHSESVLMYTGLTFSTTTGAILGANIEINATTGTLTTADGPACPNGVVQPGCVAHDVQRVVTPGIGRALGFKLISNPDSTMANILQWGELRQRAIDPGTLQGICDLYPRGQPTPGCPPPSDNPPPDGTDGDGMDSEDKGCGCTSTGSPLWGFLGLALLLGLSRQRPRPPAARWD